MLPSMDKPKQRTAFIRIPGMAAAIEEIERRNAPSMAINISHANGMAASDSVIDEIREREATNIAAEQRLQDRLRDFNAPPSAAA